MLAVPADTTAASTGASAAPGEGEGSPLASASASATKSFEIKGSLTADEVVGKVLMAARDPDDESAVAPARTATSGAATGARRTGVAALQPLAAATAVAAAGARAGASQQPAGARALHTEASRASTGAELK
jgi:hypothetical protein